MRRIDITVLAAVTMLSACTTSQAQLRDVPQSATPAPPVASTGRSCQSLRSEMMKMEARGVSRLVDRKNDGEDLSSSQRREIDTYNGLLNEYLASRCHLN